MTPTFQSRNIRNQKKSIKWPWIVLFLWFLFFSFFFSVRNIGGTLIEEGTYSLEKWTTLTTLPKSLDIDLSSWKYKLWIRYFLSDAPSIQAGTYKIDHKITLSDFILTNLKAPTYTDSTITILPGWNIYDIDASLSSKNIIKTGELLLAARDSFSEFQSKYVFLKNVSSLEWFLYPDTYRIAKNADAKMILDRLLSEFQKKIGDSYISLESAAYKDLILASIVEREERDSSQKPIVADILAKRVKEGIPMGADATVCYGYAKTQKQCTPTFIGSVIHEKSAYNTRNKQWYPPTPIASISLDTWNAVLNKETSPYYYYLHDSNGKIHFAKNLQEHNINKSKYIE